MDVYHGRRNKNVLLLSTWHPNVNIELQNKKELPETVEFYVQTRCKVDIFYQMTNILFELLHVDNQCMFSIM